jgi:hypothetical protein
MHLYIVYSMLITVVIVHYHTYVILKGTIYFIYDQESIRESAKETMLAVINDLGSLAGFERILVSWHVVVTSHECCVLLLPPY